MTFRDLSFSSADDSWYTPTFYCDLAREVLDSIKLDPASCAEANEYVKAESYFTKEFDGLLAPWLAESVFLNAPGGRGKGLGQAVWQAKLIQEYEAKRTKQAVMLVYKVATETKWFQQLLKSYPICFVNHRIKFIAPEGKYQIKNSQPLHGNAFVYFGDNNEKFKTVFSKIGIVVS